MAVPFVRDNGRNNQVLGRFTPDDLVFSDEFLNGTVPDPNKWRHTQRREKNPGQKNGEYKYQAGLNRVTANRGIRADGTPDPDDYTDGKRFGLYYDDHKDKVITQTGGRMGFGAYHSDERDPTMPDFNPNDSGQRLHPYLDDRYNRGVDLRNKVYGSWIDSAGIARTSGFKGFAPYIDPLSPRHAWRYGYFEHDMDVRDMMTPDFRMSTWLMPYCNPEADPTLYALDTNGNSAAGDGIAATGCEIDLHEYAPSKGALQTLLMKVPLVGGSQWGKRNTEADQWGYVGADGIPRVFDLRQGLVTIGLWWEPNGLHYYINGVEVNRDLSRVPKIAQYFNLTREATECNGVGVGGPSIVEPWRKSTVTGWLYGENFGAYLDQINQDKCWYSYIRVWQDKTLNGSGPNSNWKDPNNLANAIDRSTPEGVVARYADAAPHGERYGVPVRYDPSGGTDSSFNAGNTSISISTASVDNYNLHYVNGKLTWNTEGGSFDIRRHNVDDIANESDYVASSSTGEYEIDAKGPGIYSVTQNGVSSQVINVIVGLNSRMPDGTVVVSEGPGGTGVFVPPTTGPVVSAPVAGAQGAYIPEGKPGIRHHQGMTKGAIIFELEDVTMKGKWDYSAYDGVATIVGTDTAPTLVLDMQNSDAVHTIREVFFVPEGSDEVIITLGTLSGDYA